MREFLRLEPGWGGFFTRERAFGAMPNGTRIVKTGSKPGDANQDGVPGVVLGSLLHPDTGEVMYFVEWASMPRTAVAVSAHRIRVAAV